MKTFQYKFVKYIPEVLEDEIIYISIEFRTVLHKCPCGCGNKVITPISQTDWELSYNGESISLSPSILNLNLKCKSHYWIIHNKIRFVRKWREPGNYDNTKR
jgi:hypothetical protein